MNHNVPTKTRQENFKAGEVIILKPADPKKIEEWRRQQKLEQAERRKRTNGYMDYGRNRE